MADFVFVTLGPEGTNHHIVLRDHLDRVGVEARILLADDAESLLALCGAGRAQSMMICAAHPAAPSLVTRAQYRYGILLQDCFIAKSQPLAILTRTGCDRPRRIALHTATRPCADLTGFDEVIEVASTVAAFEGLVSGQWDAALSLARFADAEKVQLCQTIAAPRDAWLVLGRDAGIERPT